MSNLYDSERKNKIDKAFLGYASSFLSSSSQEKIAKKMFKELKKHIGEEVECAGWWYGGPYEKKGELKEVNDFVGVLIGDTGIPFVGEGAAICSITSKDDEILYFNPFIEDNYDRRDAVAVEDAVRSIFGYRIAQKRQAIREKEEKRMAALFKNKREIGEMLNEKDAANSVTIDNKNK